MNNAFSLGQAVAGFLVFLGRAVRDRIRERRALRSAPVRRAWCEQSGDGWLVRRSDGLSWDGSDWSSRGKLYGDREDAERVISFLVSSGRAYRLP